MSEIESADTARLIDARTAELTAEIVRLRAELEQLRQHKEAFASQRKQLRSLANEITLVEARERRAIAADLHDGIGQSLAMIKSKIVDLQGDAVFSGFHKNLSAILTLLDNAIRATRSLTFEISSPILYELGLTPAIRWLSEQYSEKHGLHVTVHEKERMPNLRNDLRVMLFKCVRELLTNVVKYAMTNEASVTVDVSGTLVRITVADAGTGFDAERFDARPVRDKGFGLFSIRERLEQLDGQMLLESAPGKGTKVILIVALTDG